MFQLAQDVYHVQTRQALLDNSITVKVGDLIAPTASGDIVSNADVSGYVLGLVVGFAKKNGEVIGQGQDPSLTPNQITTPADNTTNTKYNAVYIPITDEMEFKMTLSNTAGTTPLSDKAFVWFNLADCRTVNEASVIPINGTGAPLQILSFGLDPLDPTKKTIIGRIAKNLMSR